MSEYKGKDEERVDEAVSPLQAKLALRKRQRAMAKLSPSERQKQTAAIGLQTQETYYDRLHSMIIEANWIQKAIKRPGALKRKDPTPKTKLTSKDLAALKKRGGRTARQANLATTLGKLRRKK